MAKPRADGIIAENRKARFNYQFIDFYEGGLVLTGPEVKSLRQGGGHINEAYASFSRGELWLIGSHIAPYANAGYAVQEERRSRKILLNKAELEKIQKGIERSGETLVPLRLFWSKNKIKVALALAKGKKLHDKRASIKERDMERQARRTLKGR
ncbi:MAG: SsrA-binding protein SmpB [Proteobacteria bacterium]|nr:SsrA-binding protein SmpB [Pseudomonadota bacterium]